MASATVTHNLYYADKLKYIAEVIQAPILFHLSLVKFQTLTTPVPMLQLTVIKMV